MAKAMALARNVCKSTENMPKREAYGLADQIRRAAVSVASNIAEGYGRLSDLQFRVFLGNARGSLCELQTQVQPATDLDYLKKGNERELVEKSVEAARILNGLIASLKSRSGTKASSTSAANPASTAV